MGQGAGRRSGGSKHQICERQRQTGRDMGSPVLRRRHDRQSHGGEELADYVDWRLSQPKRPAVVTLKNERTAIRQLLRFAKRRGYVSDVPEFVIKSGKTNARPDIPEVEWHRLTRFLPPYVDRARDKRRQRERFYLALYILILCGTGIRVGEARKLGFPTRSDTPTPP